ncbi:alpha/beta hydrolase family protein [Cohnella silvisoli]|uniref:Alpha/beta fold hydrolase n=1 Tax=Cohnella silvisoli TaxID=2873699 RepID=A0ABV1KRB8_9BACL|nr:alpha/beta fold hydrolase [Cohnella silvisoli]MCD9024602.1 alpha/beta fold hydrolase [Cohnella silvisoli]
MERPFTIRHEDLTLAATIHYPSKEDKDTNKKMPLVVICHGFVGSRIGVDRLFLLASRKLASQGFFVLRFDFAGCGESDGIYGEHGLDSMIAQTRSVLDYGLSLDCVDPLRVTLLGHSLGGAVALLTGTKDRRVKSLALWSPVAHPFNDILRIVGRGVYDEAVKKGFADYHGYRLKPEFFESLQQHQPFQEAPQFQGDVFIAHGTADETILADYSFLLEKTFWLRGEGRCDKNILFQADHTYTQGVHKAELYQSTSEWLASHEKRQRDWQHWSI